MTDAGRQTSGRWEEAPGPGAVGARVDRAGAPQLRHVPALDGMRGAAVVGVLLFHGGHLKGGYLGVDLFFTLSGFLITSLLLAEVAGRGGVSLTAFWSRRARRLLPALALVLVAVAAYAWLVAAPEELHRIRWDGLATVGYVANWRMLVVGQDYWGLFTAPSPLLHTWSLAIEEQFYVVWPLLVVGALALVGRRRLARTVLVGSLVLAAISAALVVVFYERGDPLRAYLGTDARAASILLGAALAATLVVRGPVRSQAARWALEALALGGVVGLAVAWTHLGGLQPALYRGGLLACGLAAVAVLAAVAHPQPLLLSRALSWGPLRALGIISYGLYLWHWPVYVYLNQKRTGLHDPALLAVRLGVTLVVATASFVLVEQPVRRGRVRTPQLRVLAPVAAVVVIALLALSTTGARRTVGVGETADDLTAARHAADDAPAGARRVLVVGNSVGLFLGEGMKQLRLDPPVVVTNRARLACSFPAPEKARLDDGTPLPSGEIDCAQTWAQDVRALRPDRVLLLMNASVGNAQGRFDGEWLEPCMPEYDALLRSALEDGVKTLSKTGAEVELVGAAYGVGFGKAVPQTDCVNRVYADVAGASPAARYIDLAHHVCPTPTSCKEEIDGVTLRSDGVHYRDEGARLIGRWLLDQALGRG